MKSFLITFILTLSVTPAATHRRILHQPLFPANSTTPPPPPGPPTSDNPFFNETPSQQTPDQPPPPPSPEAPATHPIAPAPAKKSGKKVAVVISVGIVTLGMLSGLAFFVYKHKSKQHIESVNDGEDLPPARFLDVGTDSVNGSPYNNNNNNINNKLNSVKTSDRYRPSPDLQPLPPLSKLPVSEAEEEEIHDFYTPHGSTASTDEGYSVRGLNIKRIHRKVSSPNSNRTSPKSRLSVCSSPDSMTISPVKQPPPIKTTSTSPAAKVIPKIIKPTSSQYISDDDLQADDGSKPKMKPPRP